MEEKKGLPGADGSAPVFVDVEGHTVAAPLEGPAGPPSIGPQSFHLRYQARAALGHGGMGEVNVYRDCVIGREIAIKRIRAGLSVDARDEVRFLREARVQGQLEHPAIVPVYDMGRDSENAAYFAMKRVRGQTLERVIESMRASEPTVVRQARRRLLTAFSSICLAIEFAHRHGVLHRDLKPANVMLGDFGEVYVLDWGLAKVGSARDVVAAAATGSAPGLVEATSEPSAGTVAGATLGTPGYMSPEQISGDAVDERSDVYALGVMLFELLALEPLHQGETTRQLHTSTLRGCDARPSLRRKGDDIPPELDAVCTKATALEPGERYATARELHADVERYLDGDRDVERRRELAGSHATSAAAAAAAARVSGSVDLRSRALAEVGRALALDPSNTLAVSTLLGLLSELPRTMPREAEEELAAAGRSTSDVFARSGPLGVVLALACLPLFGWLGVRSWPGVAAIVALWAALGWARRSRVGSVRDGTLPWHVPVIAFTAAGATSLLFGPFLLVPAIAIVLAFNASMAPGRSRHALIKTLAIASFVVPWALQRLGFVPGGLIASGDALVMRSALLHFPPVATDVALLVTHVGVLFVGLTIASRLRSRLQDAERSKVLQTWQLRQLIPAELRAAARAGGS